LADFKGHKTVVLYFYPKADTPGCTAEACGFRDALADYGKGHVAVLGISPDPDRGSEQVLWQVPSQLPPAGR
jgi:peroxiredoxin Q/BCP